MSERPFMQLYVSDYLGDTRHLSCEQHGAYLLVLMTMWNAGGSLPNDDVKLSRIVCLSVKKWRSIKDDILAFFDVSEASISHNRLTNELRKSERKSELRASAGAAGGAAKSLKDKQSHLANARVLPCHSPDTRELKETPNGVSKKQSRSVRLTAAWQIPEDWIDEAVSEGLSRSKAFFEAERMKNWSISNKNGAKLDWRATWRNWFRDKIRPPDPQPRPSKPTKITDVIQAEARKYGVLPDEPDSTKTRLLDASDTRGSATVLELPLRSSVTGLY